MQSDRVTTRVNAASRATTLDPPRLRSSLLAAGANGGSSAASKRYLAFLSVASIVLLFASVHVIFGILTVEAGVSDPSTPTTTSSATPSVTSATTTNSTAATTAAAVASAEDMGAVARAAGIVPGLSGAGIWALIVSFITIRDVIVLLSMQSDDVSRKMLAALLLVLWGLTSIATTIEGPFRAAGNGYFAVWLGTVRRD